MKILVTGGAGFIGSHVVDRLLERGDDVDIMDDLSAGFRHNVPNGARLHKVDIRSKEAGEIIRSGGYDVLAHLAAQMSVAVSTKDPCFDADVNIGGLLNLMEATRAGGTIRKVVFASTGGAMYDDNVPWPTPEEEIARPLSPYGIAKLASEWYLRYYNSTHHIPYTALRFGNVYGPRQNPHGEAGVIAIFARKMILGEPVRINGDGLQTRDYVYVGDVVNAFVAAIERDVVDSINIGTSVETSVQTLHRELARITGHHLPAMNAPAQPGEVRRSCLLNKKARDLLGWTPTIELAHGLESTVEFFRRKSVDPQTR